MSIGERGWTRRIQRGVLHKSSCISSRRIEHRSSYVMGTGSHSCRRQLKYYEITYNEYVWPAIHSTLALSTLSLAPPFALARSSLLAASRIHTHTNTHLYMHTCMHVYTGYGIFAARMKHRYADARIAREIYEGRSFFGRGIKTTRGL